MNWAISKGEMRVCVCSVHGKKWTAHRNMVVKIWKKRSTLKILVEAGKLLHGIYTEVTSRYIYTEVTLRYIYRSYFTVYIQKLLHGIYIYIYIYTEVTSRYIYTEVTSRYRYRSYFTVYIQKLLHGIYTEVRIKVAARSKARVCGRSLAGIAGSNPAEGIDICLLWVLCVVRYRSLRLADHSSRGVLPSVVCLMSMIAKPRKGRSWPGIGSKCWNKKNI